MDFEAVMRDLETVPSQTDFLRLSGSPGFTTEDYTSTGSRSRVAYYQAQRPLALRPDTSAPVALVAYESKTTDGNSDQDTFNLSHDLIETGATADNIVAFEGDTTVSLDSVDYANDTITYTDQGTGNDLHLFYATGDQAQVTIQKTAPDRTPVELWQGDVSIVMLRDQSRDPLTFDFQHPLEAVVPTDWNVEVYVDGPYSIVWGKDVTGGAAEDITATNALLDLPIRQSEQEIEGLHRAVKLYHASQ
jgi:hypothetical protein